MIARRTWLKHLAASGMLGAAGLAGLIREVLAAGVRPVAPGVQKITGEVRINGQPARVGQPVAPGDQVLTGAGAQVTYVIGQNAFLQHENSDVRFGTDQVKEFMRVVTGRLLSVFGEGQKTLAVPTATIGIRGTGCYIEASPSETYFCLCYGVADLYPSGDLEQRQTIRTKYHDHPVLIGAQSDKDLVRVTRVINHTDNELTLLENLCGRWPPFYGRSDYGGY